MKRQTGFTLIELAIVLVIIGLLLGGVLKGQELITNAKVKNIANDLKSIQVMIYGYQDKFHALPGDDVLVTSHLTGSHAATTPAASQGNAQIEGHWDSDTQTDETYLFWEHVRLAGLSPGSAAHTAATEIAQYIPRNAEGGRLGAESIASFRTHGITDADFPGSFVACAGGLTGKIVKQIDVTLDNGETSTGSVRAIADPIAAAGASVPSANIDDNALYVVCYSF